MISKDKFGREEIERIKAQIKDHFEKFRNNVSQHKLCRSFPEAKLNIDYCTKELGRSPSKAECFEIICNFLLEQQNSETFEHLEQHLKEQKHWILKDIFPDGDIGEDQVKLCSLEKKNESIGVVQAEVKFVKNEKYAIDSAEIKKDFRVVERKSVSKSGTGVLRNINKDMANKRASKVHEKNKTKARNIGKREHSSIHGVSTINGNSRSEPDQGLGILLLFIPVVSFFMTGVWKWKKELRQKVHRSMKRIWILSVFLEYNGEQSDGIGGQLCYFLRFIYGSLFGTENSRQYPLSSNKPGGKSFLKNRWLWIVFLCGPYCLHTVAASSMEPNIVNVTVTVNHSFRLPCGGVCANNCKWKAFSLNGWQNLSADSKVFSNGSLEIPSAQFSDAATYFCIIPKGAISNGFTYRVYVKDSTVNGSAVEGEVTHGNIPDSTVNGSAVEGEVTHGNIPESKHLAEIAGGVIGSVGGLLVVAGVIFYIWKRKNKSARRYVQPHNTSHVSNRFTNGS